MNKKLALLIGLSIGIFLLIFGVLLQANRSSQPKTAAVLPDAIAVSVTPNITPVVSVAMSSSSGLVQQFPVSPTGFGLLTQRHPRKPTLPPIPVVSVPTCVSADYTGKGTTIDGGNVNPPIQYGEISTDADFSHVFRRDMTGSISIEGFQGFLSYPDGNTQFIVQPNTTYYIRFFNGLPGTSGYGPTATFSFKSCQ